jgi:hypothetical protein
VNGLLYKWLVLFLAVVLSVSVTAWLRDRQELQTVTAANLSLRKMLGEMTIAMTEKDRQIDRLAGSPCGAVQPGRLSEPRP